MQIANLNWFEVSETRARFELWVNTKNGAELSVHRVRGENTWICYYAKTVEDINLLGWFVGERDDALRFFAGELNELGHCKVLKGKPKFINGQVVIFGHQRIRVLARRLDADVKHGYEYLLADYDEWVPQRQLKAEE